MTGEQRQNESTLVCAAQRGDKDALCLLLTRNWAWLKGLVYSVVNSYDLVDDILQDICIRVIDNIGSLREPERFRPWLAVLARHQALRSRQRSSQRAVPVSQEVAELLCDDKAGRLIENLEKKEQYARVIKAIGSIPEKYRQVFMLAYSSDLTYEQIAEILDIPKTTVQIRLVRARRMIYDKVTSKHDNRIGEQKYEPGNV